jgi:hypothetical protein
MGDLRARTRGPCAWVGLCLLIVGGIIAAPTFGSPSGQAGLERSERKAGRLLVITPKKPIFRIKNARPGTRVTRTVRVRYLGKRPARLRFSVTTTGPKGFTSRLRLVVAAKGRIAYRGSLRAFRPRAVGKIKRRKTVRFRISLLLPKGATPMKDDPFQGYANKITFVWKAVPLRRH